MQHVTVEPPHRDAATASDGRWVVPPSNAAEQSHHYIHLRPDDVVHFEAHNLQIRYSLQKSPDPLTAIAMPPAVFDMEGVQVKSSDPQRPANDAEANLQSDSETEDEAAGDADRTNTPAEVTPATSRPAATNEIKETPHQDADGEDPPFSTAVNDLDDGALEDAPPGNGGPSSEIVPMGDLPDSPAARAGQKRVARAKRSQEASASRIQSFSDNDFPSSPAPPRATYGKSSRRNTPNRDAETGSTAKAGQKESVKSDPPSVPPTSQVLYPNGRAFEAASRSIPKKRKVDSDADKGEPIVKKVRKVSAAEEDEVESEPPDAAGEAEAEGESDDDDGPSQIPAGPRVSSGRLPRVARSDESSGDEIAVKSKKASARQKSSPEVVVRPQRGSKSASKTPAAASLTPTSTATSSLPGKPPKVIISNVANDYKDNSALTKFMKSQGSSLIDSVPSRRTNFLCMVKAHPKLMKTPKVLRSLALGKQVVTERWIEESKSSGELLDPADFIHAEVADSVGLDRRQLFSGKVVYFTNAVVKEYGSDNWSEMKALATEAGASSVESGTGDKGGTMTGRNSIVYIGTNDDADATTLIEDYSRVVYHKDMVKDAVVSGELDLEDGKYRLKAGKVKKAGRR